MSGNVRYKCPSCKAFLSLAPFIQRFNNWVMCRSCGRRVHVPSEIIAPLNKSVDALVTVPVAPSQMSIFGGGK